jgi:hypothetical protein
MELAARYRAAALGGDAIPLATLEDVSARRTRADVGRVDTRLIGGAPCAAGTQQAARPVGATGYVGSYVLCCCVRALWLRRAHAPRLRAPPPRARAPTLQLFLLYCNEGRKDRVVLGLTDTMYKKRLSTAGELNSMAKVRFRGAAQGSHVTSCMGAGGDARSAHTRPHHRPRSPACRHSHAAAAALPPHPQGGWKNLLRAASALPAAADVDFIFMAHLGYTDPKNPRFELQFDHFLDACQAVASAL